MDESNSTNITIDGRAWTSLTDSEHVEMAGAPNTQWDRSLESETSRSSDSDADNERQTESDMMALPTNWFSSVPMPKNWYQVEKLKEQRRLLQQNLLKKTSIFSQPDSNMMDEIEIKTEDFAHTNSYLDNTHTDTSFTKATEGVCESRSAIMDDMNQYAQETGSCSGYSQEDSPPIFTEPVDDCELRSLSAEELNTYLTDAASLSHEFEEISNTSETEDGIATTNGKCNDDLDRKYTERFCKWIYGYSKNKNKSYVIPKASKSENQLHDNKVPRMLNESRSQTSSISQLKPLRGEHMPETDIGTNFANNIPCRTEDTIMTTNKTDVHCVLSPPGRPVTIKREHTPTAQTALNNMCMKITNVTDGETDVCEIKDIELLRCRVKEIQEGVVENLEKVVENITSGSTSKKIGKIETDPVKCIGTRQQNVAGNDKHVSKAMTKPVSESDTTSDQINNIQGSSKVRSSERRSEIIQQMELYELKKKINEQKIKILDMQIKELDLLKTNKKSKNHILSIKKEITNKSLEINDKQMQLMHDNSEIIEMLVNVKHNCSPQNKYDVQIKNTETFAQNLKMLKQYTSSVKRKNIYNGSPLPSPICTISNNATNTKRVSNTNLDYINEGTIQTTEPPVKKSTSCSEDATYTITASVSKSPCTSVVQDTQGTFSPSSHVLQNLKPATIAALNVGKLTTMHTNEKDIPADVMTVKINRQSVSTNSTEYSGNQTLNSVLDSQDTPISSTVCTSMCTHSSKCSQHAYLNNIQKTLDSQTDILKNINHASENSNNNNNELTDIVPNINHTSVNSNNNNNECTVKRNQPKRAAVRQILPKSETQNIMQQIIQRDPQGRFTTANRAPLLPMAHYRVSRQVRMCNPNAEAQPRIFGVQPLLPPPVIYMDKFGNIVYESNYKSSMASANIVNVPIQNQLPAATSFVTQRQTPYYDGANLASNGNQISVTDNATSVSMPEKLDTCALTLGNEQSTRKRNANIIDDNEGMESGDMAKQRKYNVATPTQNQSQHTEEGTTSSACQTNENQVTGRNVCSVLPEGSMPESKCKVNKRKRKKSTKRRLISPVPFLDFPARIVQNTGKIIVSPPNKPTMPPIEIVADSCSHIEPLTHGRNHCKPTQLSHEYHMHNVTDINDTGKLCAKDSATEDEECPLPPQYTKTSGNTIINNQNNCLNDDFMFESPHTNTGSTNDKHSSENLPSVMDSGSHHRAEKVVNTPTTDSGGLVRANIDRTVIGATGGTFVSSTGIPISANATQCSSSSTKPETRAVGKIIVLKGDTTLRWDRVKLGMGHGLVSDIKFVQHLLKNEELRQLQMKQYNAMQKAYSNSDANMIPRKFTPAKLFYPRMADDTPEIVSRHNATLCTHEKSRTTPESLDDSYGRLVIDETEENA